MKKINFKIRKNVNVNINRQSKNIFKFKGNVKNRLGNINDSVIRNIISSKAEHKHYKCEIISQKIINNYESFG